MDTDEIRSMLRDAGKGAVGSTQHLIQLLRDKGATVEEIDQSHVHEDAMVDVYIKEEDVEFRELVREHVAFHFPMHVMVNIRWIGDKGKTAEYR